jgi:hypothetical protein
MNRSGCLVVIAVLLAGVAGARAQGVIDLWPSLSTTQKFSFDAVDDASLATTFRIPIMSRQGRGISLSLNLLYNSQVWAPTDLWGQSTGAWQPYAGAGSFGWSAPMLGSVGMQDNYRGTCDSGRYPLYLYRYYFTDAGGAVHPFSGTFSTGSSLSGCPAPSSPFTETAADNSGYTLSVDSNGTPTMAMRSNEPAERVRAPGRQSPSAPQAANPTTSTSTPSITVTPHSSPSPVTPTRRGRPLTPTRARAETW